LNEEGRELIRCNRY